MKIFNNIFELKTTVIGLAFLGLTFTMMFKGIVLNEYLIGGLLLSGIILVLAPDKYIELIQEIIKGFFRN